MAGSAPKLKPEGHNRNLAPPLQELHNSPPIQTKLEVGEPGDKYEQEADQMADKVMMAPYDRSNMVMMAPNPDNPTLRMMPMPKKNMVMMAGSLDNPTLRMKPQVQKNETVGYEEEEEKVQMQPEQEDRSVLKIKNFPWNGEINTQGTGFHVESKEATDIKKDYIRPDFKKGDKIIVLRKTEDNWLEVQREHEGETQTGFVDWRYVNVVKQETHITECSEQILIGRAGECGAGADFIHDPTLPDLNYLMQLLYDSYQEKTDEQLAVIMSRELRLFAGNLGQEATVRFFEGGGATWNHEVGSVISTLANDSVLIDGLVTTMTGLIGEQLFAQMEAGRINCKEINISEDQIPIPPVHFQLADSSPTLFSIIGGTQGIELFLSETTIDIDTRTINTTLRLEICDDFGVSGGDAYSPSLLAFWMLQHEREGHEPFINLIIIERQINTPY